MVKSAIQVHEMMKSAVQVHYLALHHLHDLPHGSAIVVCQTIWCIVLHLTDSFSCTFTPSSVARSSNK